MYTDASGNYTDDDVEPEGKTSTKSVSSEVRVPHRSRRRRSRVRFEDVPDDDEFHTCVSADDDVVIDLRGSPESRRSRWMDVARDGDTRVSGQGGESRGDKRNGKGEHRSREERKTRKRTGRGHHEGGETSSESLGK